MASGEGGTLYRDLGPLAGAGTVAGLDDPEFLARFRTERGDAAEAAFEAIVRRHGPMILAVCRRGLRDPSDVRPLRSLRPA